MYCPKCLTANDPGATRCSRCRADMDGLGDHLYAGTQFVFARAAEQRPIALSVDGSPPHVVTEPEIVSRHLHSVALGEGHVDASLLAPDVHPPEPAPDLPRLPSPAQPNLTAVITERKIYRPREEARIFVIAPGAPGARVEMEVLLAGQQVTREQVTLDEAGLALRPYSDLEEGEYGVVVRRRDEKGEPCGAPAECTFSVAEFALSPLTAILEEHSLQQGSLQFRLRLVALSIPYDGSVQLGLQCGVCGGRVVATQQTVAAKGMVEAAFDIRGHGGPFHVQVATPTGETASVAFPGTGRTERERVTLCTLGRHASAGLLPGEDTTETRGLHVGYEGAQTTPVRLESAVAESGRLSVDIRALAAQVVLFDPLTADRTVLHFGPLGRGDILEFPVAAPYTLFTVGLLSEERAFEAWGIVIRPLDLHGRLLVPAEAGPGADIAVRVESAIPAACLLLVYDARLEHESPLPKLAKRMIEAMRAGGQGLAEQDAVALSYRPRRRELGSAMAEDLDIPSFLRRPSAGPETMRQTMVRAQALAPVPRLGALAFGSGKLPFSSASVEGVSMEPEMPEMVAIASREAFPELAYLELFSVREAAERCVRLGDQIGTWRCRAYLVAGLDVQELTADVQAAKPIYAELDLPASISAGDDILAAVRFHTEQPATMSITLPGGETITGAVMGHGAEQIHLTGPGEIGVHIWGEGGDDWTVRTLPPPGRQVVRASQLEILMRGQSAQGEQVVVYPSAGYLLAETIEALGRYPFG